MRTEAERRRAFETAVHAQYPAVSAAGARLTLRRNHPDSPRFGQYVAEHVEFAWKVFNHALDPLPAAGNGFPQWKAHD